MDEKVDATLDRLLVEFGKEILQIVPGKVSTEVDARFSFDVEGSINKALHIIEVGTAPAQSSLTSAKYQHYTALQRDRHRQVPRPDQARLNMGGHQGRQGAPIQARRQLQSDPYVLPPTSHCCRRSRRLPHFPFRWSYLGLVQGSEQEGIFGTGGPRCQERAADFQLLQEVRLQDHCDGR